jgi:hypothetical protein
MKRFHPRVCLRAFLLVGVMAATMGCDNAIERVDGATQNDNLYGASLNAPTGLHWVEQGDTVRLVFSRSPGDTAEQSPVAYYNVCVEMTTCIRTETNYLDFSASHPAIAKSRTVTVQSVGLEGNFSLFSQPSRYGYELTVNPKDLGVSDGQAGYATTHGALSTSGVPSKVYAPVAGSIVHHSKYSGSNKTSKAWSFWQHKSGYHHTHGGINGSNDTNAWDINLNVSGAGSNMDKKMPFYSAGYGTVVKWGYKKPGTDNTKSILVNHNGWYSGYLHAASVYVKQGDYVTPWTKLGRIGKAGSTNYHLHFAVYEGANKYKGLKSQNAKFKTHSVSVAFASFGSLKPGTSKSLTATASIKNYSGQKMGSVGLNTSVDYAQTWWKSSNPSVVSVNGYGKLTAKKAGSATVSVYYSGVKASKSIKVANASSSAGCQPGKNGNWSFCSAACPCNAGQGDCDSDKECKSGLICAKDVGKSYGWSKSVDVCQAPKASAQNSCHTDTLFGWSYCSASCPCGSGEGDCDSNSHCLGTLVCAKDVGAKIGKNSSLDICEAPKTSSQAQSCHVGAKGGYPYCSPACPCDVGQGDCDSHAECKPGLVCKANIGAQYGWKSNVDVCKKK